MTVSMGFLLSDICQLMLQTATKGPFLEPSLTLKSGLEVIICNALRKDHRTCVCLMSE